MTQRLPTPGGDSGDWGDILNAFLEVSHASDGTLNPNTVGTSQLAANSVTSSILANNSVGTTQLQSGSITTNLIANNAVTTTQLAANSVTSSILANNSVGTTQLQDAAVGPTQISTGAIGTDELADGSVTNAKLDTPTQTALTTAASALSESTADNRYIQQTQLGIASGVAQLDSTGKLETGQVPSEVVSEGGVATGGTEGQFAVVMSNGTMAWIDMPVNVKAFGAKGDGVTDDTAAITAAANTAKPVFFPAGNFIFNGPALAPGIANPIFIGAGVQLTKITVADGIYFYEDSTAWVSMLIKGITFTGNAPSGFFLGTYTGVNINNQKIVTECFFQNHQICAIQSNASNEPDWRITGNRFHTTNVTTAIDVALAGNAAGSNITGNEFDGARINLKLRQCHSTLIAGNGFIPYYAQSGGVQRARIWIVPNSSTVAGTPGCTIDANKFGNESIGVGDFQILVAGELSGTWVGDMQPDLTTAQTNPLYGLTVTETNRFCGAAGAAPPFLYTLNQDLSGSKVGGWIDGTSPAYTIQFATPPTAATPLQRTVTVGPVRIRVTNQAPPLATNCVAMLGNLDDPGNVFAGDPLTPQGGSGDPAELVDLSPGVVTGWTATNATITAETDRAGGANAAEINASVAGGSIQQGLAAQPTVGVPGWVEFDLMQGATNPVSQVTVTVQLGSGDIFFQRIINVPASWTHFAFPLAFLETGTNNINVAAVTTGTFRIGRVNVYHSRARQLVPPKALTVSGTSGTAGLRQPFSSAYYKKVIVRLNAYENTGATGQSITFPVPFVNSPPTIVHDDSGGATATYQKITLPASMSSAVSGLVVVEGY